MKILNSGSFSVLSLGKFCQDGHWIFNSQSGSKHTPKKVRQSDGLWQRYHFFLTFSSFIADMRIRSRIFSNHYFPSILHFLIPNDNPNPEWEKAFLLHCHYIHARHYVHVTNYQTEVQHSCVKPTISFFVSLFLIDLKSTYLCLVQTSNKGWASASC